MGRGVLAWACLLVALTSCASEPRYGRRTYAMDLNSNPDGARIYVLQRVVWDHRFPEWRKDFPDEADLMEYRANDEDGFAPVRGVRLPPYRYVLVGYWSDGRHGVTFFQPRQDGQSVSVTPIPRTDSTR